MSTQITTKVVNNVFQQFDKNGNQSLSKFEFVDSINYLSKRVGGLVCCRTDLDSLFQIIDTNGDETISKKQYYVLIDKFVRILINESSPALEKMVKYANGII